MNNKELLSSFYEAFKAHNADAMVNCYHENVEFEDPAFGKLHGKEAGAMWQMLLSREESNLEISYGNVEADGDHGSAEWTARYVYGPDKRRVVNHIKAEFEFKDGKIIRHTDRFNLWRWTSQALGPLGIFLGWSGFLKAKIRKKARAALESYMSGSQV